MNLSDEELAKKVQEGEKDAFAVLIERYNEKIKRYGRKFLSRSEDIEDKLQDIFLKAYKNIRSFDAKKKFSPWLYRIAHNEFINFIKKKERRPLSFVDPDIIFPHFASEEKTNEEAERKEVKQMMELCLQELEAKYRETLVLYYIEELSYEEIADVLRVPVSTVGVRLKRGRDKMRNICESTNYER